MSSRTLASARLVVPAQRERLLLGAGGAAMLAFTLWFTSRAEEAPPSPPAPAAPVPQAPPPAFAPPPPAPALPAGIMLSGVMGSGAIFSFADGQQRALPIGREVAPGLALKSVGIGHAIIGWAGGDLRLELNRFGTAAAAPSPAAPASSAPAPAEEALAAQKRETMAFRLGLAPVPSGARAGGYTIRAGARLPHLAQAGLQPGDTITGVNGSAFDEERLTELSWLIANASEVEFEFVRGGKRMKAALQKC